MTAWSISRGLFPAGIKPSGGGHVVKFTTCCLFTILLLAATAFAQPADVTSQDVAKAIQQAVDVIEAAQQPSGGWPDQSQWRGGQTALSLLALLNAGVDRNTSPIRKGLAYLHGIPNESTYVVSLRCMVLVAAGAESTNGELISATQWLTSHQLSDGTWDYSPTSPGRDNSNTQFALLGLHEAAKAGVNVDQIVWGRSQAHFNDTQNADGGWCYKFRSLDNGPSSYGSMTCAGVASLFITGEQLMAGREKGYFEGGAYQCGRYAENVHIAGGLGWLARHFTVQSNPGHGNWQYYYLYALERVGMTGGLRYIGEHDWYRLGARELLSTQRGGMWNNSLVDTCFSLLFLAKGLRPVIIQKLQWNGLWNPDRYDLAHLTEYVSLKRGQIFTWQIVPISADVEDWLTAPILYFQGHDFPKFTDRDVEKLRNFVDNGGVLVAEACCSKPAFAAGFRKFAATAFKEYPLRELSPDHPVFHAVVDLDRTHGVMGIDAACRTSVFFLPNDVSLPVGAARSADAKGAVRIRLRFRAESCGLRHGRSAAGESVDAGEAG